MALSRSPDDENPAIWNADTTLRKEDYFNQHLDGTQSPDDFEHEPELGHLLTKLYERQREESYDMLEGAKVNLQYEMLPYELPDDHPKKRQPDAQELEILKRHKEQFAIDFHQECEGFARERDRHIREYHNAKAILADMKEQDRQEALHVDQDEERGISH